MPGHVSPTGSPATLRGQSVHSQSPRIYPLDHFCVHVLESVSRRTLVDFVNEELSNNLPFILSLLQSVHAIEDVATLLNCILISRELQVSVLTHHLEWRAQFHVRPRHAITQSLGQEEKWFRAVEDGDLPTCIRMVRDGFDIHTREYGREEVHWGYVPFTDPRIS
jgi:hypothetical protein